MSPSDRPDDRRQERRDRPEENTEEQFLQSGRQGPGGQGEIHPTPSQAEGSREAMERSLGEQQGQEDEERGRPVYSSDTGIGPDDVTFTPSQAEGDRETIEEDLDEKGL